MTLRLAPMRDFRSTGAASPAGWRSILCLLLLAVSTTPTRAQSQQDALSRFERQLEQIRRDTTLQVDTSVPVGQRLLFDYGAFVQFGYLSLDDNRNDNHVLRQYDVVGYVRANHDGANEVFLRGRTGYRDFNDRDSFDGRGDEVIDPDLDRGYYRFDLRRYDAAYRGRTADTFNLVFEAGRDLVYWGNGLTLGVPIDGVITDLTFGNLTLEVVAGVTPTRTVDFDFSRPSFDHNTRRGFYGAILSAQLGVHRPFVYALAQRDYNTENHRLIENQDVRFKYDSYYLGAGSSGTLLTDRLAYGVEAVLEGGRTYSSNFGTVDDTTVSVPQGKDDVRAWAADVRLDYLFAGARKARLSAEAILASGDPDRQVTSATVGGNRHGTADHAFNAFGFLNTGLAFAPEVSNLAALRLGASTFPAPGVSTFERLQLGLDVFVYAKLREDAPVNEPTTADRYLGVEPDLYINWQITNDFSLAVRYGAFFPGSAFGPNDDVRQFFYAGVTYAF